MAEKTVNRRWPEELLNRLKAAQQEEGYISPETMRRLADEYGLPANDVFGVASFYSYLSVKPKGRHVIRVCRSLPCHLAEGEAVMARLERELGIKPGQTTPDGRFSLEVSNCIGLCDQPPAILIDDNPHQGLTADGIPRILQSYR